MPVLVKLDSTYSAFDAKSAAKGLAEYRSEIPALARRMRDACRPVSHDLLTKRLTALGMTMAPNRPSAEATMWLHETSRLLGDLPADIFVQSVDECQRRSVFLPTVAEIRAIADPAFSERKTKAARLEAILVAMDEPSLPSPGQPSTRLCEPKQAEDILREYGLLDAVRRA